MEQEIWKPVVGYEGLYEVSSLGNVKSLSRLVNVSTWEKQKYILGKKMAFYINYGYNNVDLSNKKKKKCKVHRLVAEAFIPNPDKKPYINHINSIRNDNRVENLEWCTARENTLHGVAFGSVLCGEANAKSKLKEAQVLEIFNRTKNETHINISKDYGISRSLVGCIANKKNWKKLLKDK